MQRKFEFSVDEYYHIYNRGVDKRVIFSDAHDYERFLKLLYLCNSSEPVVMKEVQNLTFSEVLGRDRSGTMVNIGCFCLMPNHFHLLIKEKEENGITLFVKKVLTAYSMYFNKKYDRTGNLFEGPFRATHVAEDSYLEYLFAYIHLNPIKIINKGWKEEGVKNVDKEKDFFSNYRYSSYQEYSGKKIRPEARILNKDSFPDYFSTERDFETLIDEGLIFQGLSLGNS